MNLDGAVTIPGKTMYRSRQRREWPNRRLCPRREAGPMWSRRAVWWYDQPGYPLKSLNRGWLVSAYLDQSKNQRGV
jgi:hypothetical protein